MQALRQHLQLAAVDDNLHRLAFSIAGLGIMLHVGHDVVNAIRPQLIADAPAIDRYVDRILVYAMAMVEAEARARAAPRHGAARKPPVKAAAKLTPKAKAQPAVKASAKPLATSLKKHSVARPQGKHHNTPR